MEFGLALPGRGPLAAPEVILKIAAKAEALKFASLFVTDHVVLPVSTARSVYPYSGNGQFPGGGRQDYLEPLTMLGYLAHATRRVRLGTSVLVLPYRHPLTVAKMLATADQLARGRVILGAGTGWLREEFEALGAPPFEERGRVTDEYLALMRVAWTTDPVTFEGRHCRVRDVHVLPKPVQRGGIPIWIGGHTEAALRRAGALGDGWHPIGLRPPAVTLTPEEYAAKAARVRDHAKAAGRDPEAITLSLRVPMEVRGPRDRAPGGERPLFQGMAADVAGDVGRYQAAGVSHLVFDPARPELPALLASLERFAEDVMPRVHAAARTPRNADGRRARPRPARRGARR